MLPFMLLVLTSACPLQLKQQASVCLVYEIKLNLIVPKLQGTNYKSIFIVKQAY